MTRKEFKEAIFATGEQAGFSAMELYFSSGKSLNIKVFQEEIDNYSLSQTQGVGFRGEYHGRMGYAYTEMLDTESVQFLVEEARDNAGLIESNDEIALYPGDEDYPAVTAFNGELAALGVEEKIALARQLETAALAADERVTSVNYAMFAEGEEGIEMVNTKGLECSFRRNSGACFVMVVVKENDRVKTGSSYTIGNRWDRFDAKNLAEEAVAEAVSMLDADTIASRQYPVVLRNDAAGDLLQTFAGVFSADNVQKGLSRLEGQLNKAIANAAVTLMDDPLLEDGAGSAPFDGEGVATYSKAVVEQGVLRTFFHNLKTAKKDSVASTGNGYRASFKAPITVAPSNFFVKPGEQTFDQLVEHMGSGLVITDLQGLHSGANPVSGDFSLAAQGYLVENGQRTQAVDQITVAGNFFDVLQEIAAVGADLKFGMGGQGGNVGSPSLYVKSLAVAGK